MIHWGWLVLAVFLSALFGAGIMALLAAKGQGDRCDECAVRLLSKKACEECLARMRVDMETYVNMRDAEIGRQIRESQQAVLRELMAFGRDPNLCDLAEEHNVEVE